MLHSHEFTRATRWRLARAARWFVNCFVTERRQSAEDGDDDERLFVERRCGSSSSSCSGSDHAGVPWYVDAANTSSLSTRITRWPWLHASSPATASTSALTRAASAASSRRSLPPAASLVWCWQLLQRHWRRSTRWPIDRCPRRPTARRPLRRLPRHVPTTTSATTARRLPVQHGSVLTQLLRSSRVYHGPTALPSSGSWPPCVEHRQRWTAALFATFSEHQAGTRLSLDGQQLVLRSHVRLDAWPGRTHWSGTRRSARPERLRVSVARLLSTPATFQGQVQAHQPHPRSHRRKTISVSVSRLRQSVRAQRESQDTQTHAHRSVSALFSFLSFDSCPFNRNQSINVCHRTISLHCCDTRVRKRFYWQSTTVKCKYFRSLYATTFNISRVTRC